MFVKIPTTATAMALVLGLAGPLPVAAQDRPQCTLGAELPCVTDTGAVVETQQELDTYVESFPAEAEEAAGQADAVPASSDPAAAADLPQCAEGGAVPCVTAEGAVVESEVELQSYVDAFPDASAGGEAAATDGAAGSEAATEEPAAEAAPEAEAAAPEPAPEAAPAEAATEAPAPEAGPETEAAAPEPAPEAAPEQTAGEEPAPEAAPADTAAQGMAQTEATDAPAAAAAAAPEAAAEAEVEETVVTEETARSSSEDFQTEISRQDASSSDDDDNDMREMLGRALAAGLAGAALTALLDQGGQVTADSGDRLVLQEGDGNLRLFRDENALLRQPGARVRTETFDDGSTRTRVLRDDGSEVVTIRAADGTLLRRTRILPDGREVLLIDDMVETRPVEVARLPDAPREAVRYTGDEAGLRDALARAMSQDVGRAFSLRQIREIDRVRYLAPEIEIDEITFASGSAAIDPGQARQLATLGRALVALIDEYPGEVFLIEGHTDAVGDASYNLALSDRRAESVALALSEYFDVPPENLVVQGYGEFDLKVPTQTAERENRRANVRRITGLLGIESAALR